MARKKKSKFPKMTRKGAAAFRYAGAVGSIGSKYHQVKREYHRLGDQLFKAKHGGRSAKQVSAGRRKKKTKHRRSR